MSFDVFSFCFHSVFVEFRRRSLAQPSLCLLVSQSRGQLFSNIVRVQVALVTTKIRYLHSKSLLEHLPVELIAPDIAENYVACLV